MANVELPDSPGPWKLNVVPYEKDDPEQFLLAPPGHLENELVTNPGWSLAEFRERLGGEQGYLEDPEGKSHLFSLKPWASADPNTQRFRVQFVGPVRHDPNLTAQIRKLMQDQGR